MTIICADYSDDTEVTSTRNQNKVAFLDGLRDKLDMPKPKKAKPKGVQFRSAAKKKESVKGVYMSQMLYAANQPAQVSLFLVTSRSCRGHSSCTKSMKF